MSTETERVELLAALTDERFGVHRAECLGCGWSCTRSTPAYAHSALEAHSWHVHRTVLERRRESADMRRRAHEAASDRLAGTA